MNILISIVIPVYNVESYLDRCIQSILNQTHKHLEIILINDGSTDSSGSICEKYALIDHRVKVYHIENGGSSIARNFGLKICSGEYIGFVDSDDWIMPNMFAELLKFSKENNLKVVETSSIQSHLADKNSLFTDPINVVIEDRDTALKRIISNTRFAVWRRLYHHTLLENRSFIEGILHQDVYYTIDILNEISHIGYFQNQFYVYNVQNPTSVIRSDYSIKRLNSINAGAYVVEHTTQYNKEIQDLSKQYLIKFLTYHYDALYFYPHLDEDCSHRKNIRKTIKTYYNTGNFDIYSFAIVNFPPVVYKTFLILNNRRIKIQVKIFQLFRNV